VESCNKCVCSCVRQRDQLTPAGVEDSVSVAILRMFHGVMLDAYSPREVVGDGNCLYRAVSLALYGTEAQHIYVRLLTSIELILHSDTYNCTDSLLSTLPVPPLSYDALVAASLNVGSYSELAHMYAVSAAVGVVIQSYMPPSHSIGLGFNPYTRAVVGRGLRTTAAPTFAVMWTMTRVPQRAVDFVPQHFVFLADITTTSIVQLDNAPVDDDQPPCVARPTSPEPAAMLEDNDTLLSSRSSTVGSEQDVSADVVPVADVTVANVDSTDGKAADMIPLPRTDGLSMSEMLEILRRCAATDVLSRIPFGRKDNVYCVVSNRTNNERIGRRVFDDDCGAWQSDAAHTSKYPYLVGNDGSLRRIYWRKEIQRYCREKKVDNKRVYEPIEPQPAADSVVTFWRYCSLLKVDNTYKRRITCLTSADGDGSVAVVEYLGTHVPGQPHGNTRQPETGNAYVRTPAATLDAISDLTKQMPPNAVYNKLVTSMDVHNAPRDSNVVHCKKKRDAQNVRQQNGLDSCRNFADEWLSVYNLMRSDDFIRFFGALRNRVPNLIVYTDRQVRDIKAMCFNRDIGSVLSFDKTFNLGAIYVTASVYKNVVLHRKRTGDHPLFLGPIFIHGHSDTMTYGLFFAHLAHLFTDCDQHQLTLGSDEELALRQCMHQHFPRAALISCTRHVQQNVGRWLDARIGSRSTARRAVYQALFGDGGLTSCNDVITFDASVRAIRQNDLQDCPSEFVSYFEQRVHPLLRSNVVAGRSGWTNNNSESINHVIKQFTQWRPQQLPDLVDKLRQLVNGQYCEADRAMLGRDFMLVPSHAKQRLTVNMWGTMSAAQREKAS